MHDVNTEREKLIYNMFLTSTFHFQSEGDFEMPTLLRSDMKNVLSTHRERVLAGIKMLAEMNQLAVKPLQMDSEKQMVSWHCLYCTISHGSGVGQSLTKYLYSKYYL